MLTGKQVFDLGIEVGIAADPRGTKKVREYLIRTKERYDDMKPSEREFFDTDRLTNPYPDSAIHVMANNKPVKRVLAGIDISASEIILASQLGERGKPIDLVIAHHPVGKAIANLHEVMDMTADIFENYGVPVHLAEKMVEERVREIGRSVHKLNHYQVVTVAELLGINFINTHTITDNLVQQFIEEYLTKEKPKTIGDLMDALMRIPEYVEAKKLGSGPKVFAGNAHHRVGKLSVEMTGGTEPTARIYEQLARQGVSTIVGMHMREETLSKVNEEQLNIVMAGHMSSDSLGMNLFLDELEKKGIEVVPCGGLIRVSRVATAKSRKKQ